MTTAANYPEDFTHKYSYNDFNYGKAELYIREPSAEELNFALEIICSYISNNKHTVISAKFDREEQIAKCTIMDKEKEKIYQTLERMNENKSEEKKEKEMKSGDKFIIEIGDRIEKIAFPNGQFQLTGEYYNIKGTFAMISEREYENLKKYDEEGIKKEGYEKGLNELWEALKQVNKMHLKDYEECTGERFKYNLYSKITPMEFVEKFKEWKEKKKEEEVKVGDEIQSSEQTEKAVVLSIGADGYWGCLQNNSFFTVNDKQKKYWKKTGKHYDEVEELLEKLEQE